MHADILSVLRLLQISDSAFPSGGFAFSNGLETVAQEGAAAFSRAEGAEVVSTYVSDQLLPRWMSFDRWYLVHAMSAATRADAAEDALIDLDRRCDAQNTVTALCDASRRMGRASLASHTRIGTGGVAAYQSRVREGRAPGHLPIVQGLVAHALALTTEQACGSAAFQVVSGALSSAVRLGLIGALESQSIQTALAATVSERLGEPLGAAPHAFAPYADIAAMRHGAGDSRLFAA